MYSFVGRAKVRASYQRGSAPSFFFLVFLLRLSDPLSIQTMSTIVGWYFLFLSFLQYAGTIIIGDLFVFFRNRR